MPEGSGFAKNMDGERVSRIGVAVALAGAVVGCAGFCCLFVGRQDLMGLGMLVAYLGLRYDTFANLFTRWHRKRKAGRGAASHGGVAGGGE